MPKPSNSGEKMEEKPRGEASEDLCEMALDPELLPRRREEEFGMCGRPDGGFDDCGLTALALGGASLDPCEPCSRLT